MEYGFSILMLCFAGMLLLYAGLLALTGDYKLIPRNYAVKMKDKKGYARQMAKVVALVSLAPLECGLIALFGWNLIACIVGLGQMILSIWGGTKLMKPMIDEG